MAVLRSDVAILKVGLAGVESGLAACATKHELAALESNLWLAVVDSKNEMQRSMFNLVLGAVLINAVTVVGAMLALGKFLGH